MYSLQILYTLCLLAACRAAITHRTRQETDPELTAGYVEGDMVLAGSSRNGFKSDAFRWPNKIVYYKFHTNFDDEHREHILHGMSLIERVSCVRFAVATEAQTAFLNITGLVGGCYSSVGWDNNVRYYNLELYPLESGCFRLGTIVHELLHTLGFFHMHSSYDRDDYVHIARENMLAGSENNFIKYDSNTVDNFDTAYDYGSVLHYSAYAFSANGQRTIVPVADGMAEVIGQRQGMSDSDIAKLNIMYRCPLRT